MLGRRGTSNQCNHRHVPTTIEAGCLTLHMLAQIVTVFSNAAVSIDGLHAEFHKIPSRLRLAGNSLRP